MRNIRLDGRIFDDPAFQALVNTERQIVREPVGRPNPFAPIGSDMQVASPLDAQSDAQNNSNNGNPQPEPEFTE
jgi:hypothetical protein